MTADRSHGSTSCGCGSGSVPCACGCCAGSEAMTPVAIANRPGLDAIAYRVGTHGRFLKTMLARLSSTVVPALEGLTTRQPSDFSIALLDAWAMVADVLTFYDERIANEGYLRTATERRSIIELARLVGYEPRPGVAATAYLAYMLEKDHAATLARNSRAQSVPGPGELPQTFETVEELSAYAPLNVLIPRLRRPQFLTAQNLTIDQPVFIDGLAATLKVGDRLLARFVDAKGAYAIVSIERETDASRTTLQLEPLDILFESLPVATAKVVSVKAIAADALTHMPAARPWLTDLRTLLRSLDRIDVEPKVVALVRHKIFPELRTLALLHATDAEAIEWMWRLAGALIAALRGLPPPIVSGKQQGGRPATPIGVLTSALVRPPSVPPANALRLARDPARVLAPDSDAIAKLMVAFFPELHQSAYQALSRVPSATPSPMMSLELLRVRGSLFGHNAPPKHQLVAQREQSGETTTDVKFTPFTLEETWAGLIVGQALNPKVLPLDAVYDDIQVGSSVVIERPAMSGEDPPEDRAVLVRYHEVVGVQTRTLTVGALSTPCTVLTFRADWLPDRNTDRPDDGLALLAGTRVYAAPQSLTLADEPIVALAEDIEDGATTDIELDRLYQNLESGRWAIVTGELTDDGLLATLGKTDPDRDRTTGVTHAELVMIAQVETRTATVAGTDLELPGDTLHTFIRLAAPLAHRYKRDTVRIYANVVKATHGESKQEVLGAGDATRPFQRFTLKQPPLTYVAAPTAAGAASTLEVFVNDVRWREVPHMLAMSSTDRGYIIRTGDDSRSAVVFGDGITGMRPPTGVENIRAKYRSGIGRGGNVAAGAITLLASRPLGVKEVVNPLGASGGADRESRDTARRNAPKAVRALDRLISVKDYADFAESFAGIGKASAVALSDGRRRVVHVTIAGVDDIPIEPTSDLFRNLRLALAASGDPHQPLELAIRDLRLIMVEAAVRLLPDYVWEAVEPAIRAAMLERFGFERRQLGQDVVQADVLATIQGVRGVAYVDLNTFTSVTPADIASQNPAAVLAKATRIRVRLAHAADADEIAAGRVGIVPAGLAMLSGRVPETLILSELP